MKHFRELQKCCLELLRKIVQDNDMASYIDELIIFLDDMARSRTAKLWVGVVIKPVVIMMQ
jgi:hypothetical protein